jgi:hypothetical protein
VTTEEVPVVTFDQVPCPNLQAWPWFRTLGFGLLLASLLAGPGAAKGSEHGAPATARQAVGTMQLRHPSVVSADAKGGLDTAGQGAGASNRAPAPGSSATPAGASGPRCAPGGVTIDRLFHLVSPGVAAPGPAVMEDQFTRSLTVWTGPRDSHGRIDRSEFARRESMKRTGYPDGRPGYVVDHIIPLKRGGADSPENMQWQIVDQARAKDRIE